MQLSGLVDGPLAAPLAGCTVGSPDAQFVMVEWSDSGGPESVGRLIAPLHVHHTADEIWYVLSGRLGFRVGDRRLEAGPGSAVFGPRGVPHTYWNAGTEPTRYLLVMTPDTLRMIDEVHELPDPDLEAVQAVFHRHDCEIVVED